MINAFACIVKIRSGGHKLRTSGSEIQLRSNSSENMLS